MRHKTGYLEFPNWKTILYDLIDEFVRQHPELDLPAKEAMQLVLDRLAKVRAIIDDYHPARVHELLGSAQARYVANDPLDEVLERLRIIPTGPNEFYTAFDMRNNDFLVVDPRVKAVLGIEPEQFNIHTLLGFDSECPLFHPEDVNHWIRWGSLGYLMLCLPFFSFESMQNCFQISFRVNVSMSSIPVLREAGYVLLEQKAYPHFESGTGDRAYPTWHLDHWTVHPAPPLHYVRPDCAVGWTNHSFVNALIYALNAFMLDLPVKHVLLLGERYTWQRNKLVADHLNQKIMASSGIEASFDEFVVGNQFGKSIRPAVQALSNTWNRGPRLKPKHVDSDQAAVDIALGLGLLPVPSFVEQLALRGITDAR